MIQLKDYLHYYIGCDIFSKRLDGEPDPLYKLVTVTVDDFMVDLKEGATETTFRWCSDLSPFSVGGKRQQLLPILRHLSDITDEEVLEVALLESYRFARHYQKQDLAYELSRDKWNNVTVIVKAHGNEKYRIGINVVECDGIRAYHAVFGTNDAFDDYFAANQFKITAYLLKQGFDLFGLIDAGLAIDAKTIQPVNN